MIHKRYGAQNAALSAQRGLRTSHLVRQSSPHNEFYADVESVGFGLLCRLLSTLYPVHVHGWF
jgi:hypothetical protein